MDTFDDFPSSYENARSIGCFRAWCIRVIDGDTYDFILDLQEVERRLQSLRFRGVKGTTGTQASFLALFHDDPARVNKIVDEFGAVTAAEVQEVAKRYLAPENRTSIDRVPEKKEGK